jgi:small subunit ribosomal protein S20
MGHDAEVPEEAGLGHGGPILPGRRLLATDRDSERLLVGTTPLVDSLAVANIKSQIKRNRQNERRRERNKAVRTELKTEVKKARTAASEGTGDATTELLRTASRALDKAASRGIVHKRAAARRKSRLAKAAGRAATGSEG